MVYLWSESEFLAFPNKTGAGTEGDPYIIRDLYFATPFSFPINENLTSFSVTPR
ncbi:MAG: hypothetical protein ACTSUE_16620 [Promethearchaeota archaeon]